VPANTYRAKKLIWPVAMKRRKFDACPNHCIFYQGEQYEKFESCPHYDASQYKRNDDGALGGPKKKGARRRGQRRSRSRLNRMKEEEGYMQRKSHALLMWYLPIIDHLQAIFGNPEETKLMS
jgi:hypothetical protein